MWKSGDLRFQNGWFTGSRGKAEHAWQANSCFHGTESPPGPCLEPSHPPHPPGAGLRPAPWDSLPGAAFPPASQAGKEEGQRFLLSFFSLITSLKISTPEGSFRVLTPFYFLQQGYSVLIMTKSNEIIFYIKKRAFGFQPGSHPKTKQKVEMIQMTNKHEKYSTLLIIKDAH